MITIATVVNVETNLAKSGKNVVRTINSLVSVSLLSLLSWNLSVFQKFFFAWQKKSHFKAIVFISYVVVCYVMLLYVVFQMYC